MATKTAPTPTNDRRNHRRLERARAADDSAGSEEIALYALVTHLLHVRRLQALLAALGLELDPLTLLERAIPLTFDRGEVDEHVLALAVGLDEPEALLCAEPLHGANRHRFPHSCTHSTHNGTRSVREPSAPSPYQQAAKRLPACVPEPRGTMRGPPPLFLPVAGAGATALVDLDVLLDGYPGVRLTHDIEGQVVELLEPDAALAHVELLAALGPAVLEPSRVVVVAVDAHEVQRHVVLL